MTPVTHTVIYEESHNHFRASLVYTEAEVFSNGALSFAISINSVPNLRAVRAIMLDKTLPPDIVTMISCGNS